MIGAVKGSSA